MRYYTTEYRDGLTTSIGNLISSLDDSYTSAINNVSETSDSWTNGLKDNALSAANHASDGVQGIIDKLNTVSTQLTTFYQSVDEIGQKMDDEGDLVIEILNTTNGVIDSLCDLLNGVGAYEGQVVSPALVDSVCEPLDEIQEPMQQFMDSYYLDEDGFIDPAAVERTYDMIQATYDPETGEFSDYGNAMIDLYSGYLVDYMSREDFNDEKMERLLNANMAAGMVQDYDSPAPPTEYTTIDGTDYYIVNFPYKSSETMDAINNRIYQLNVEGYTRDYPDTSDGVYNTAVYLDTMNTLTLDHISVSSLVPCSEVPADIENPYNMASCLDAPKFPDIIRFSTEGDHSVITFELPVDNPYYGVIFFSTENTYLGNTYDPATAPTTGYYPSGTDPFTFYYGCDYFEVYTLRGNLFQDLTEEQIQYIRDLSPEDLFSISNVDNWYDIISTYTDLIAKFGIEFAETASDAIWPLGLFLFFYGQVQDDYTRNRINDYTDYASLAAWYESYADYFGFRSGYAVLHNDNSAIDSVEIGSFYYEKYYPQVKVYVLNEYYEYLAITMQNSNGEYDPSMFNDVSEQNGTLHFEEVPYDIYQLQEYYDKLEDLATEIYPGEDFETLTEEQVSVLADRVIADLGN